MKLKANIELYAGELNVEREAAGTLRPRQGAYIEKVGTQWCVRSPYHLDRNYGCYPSKEEAEEHLKYIR